MKRGGGHHGRRQTLGNSMTSRNQIYSRAFYALMAFSVLAGLYLASRYSYLLFHSLVEIFSVVVAAAIFIIAWNTRHIMDNHYLGFLGCAYLFIGGMDLVHTLAYRGMGVFQGYGSDLATQLWIGARFLESASLLAAPWFINRTFHFGRVLASYGLISSLAVWSMFSGLFPPCYAEGVGLTPFKVAGEYVISLILVGALAALYRKRGYFDPTVLRWLMLSILFTILSELAFTFYVSVYGLSNLVGHYFKLVSFYLVYRALIRTGLVNPYDLLFRNLKRSEKALAADNERLISLQKELEMKNRKLLELSEQKNELLGIAAHDVRSPLSVIVMFSTFLLNRLASVIDREGIKFLSAIQETSNYALSLVNNILDLSAIESGKLSMETRPTDIVSLTENNVTAHRMLSKKKRISIRFDRQEGFPEVVVDAHRFEEILNNLITNAVKFSHAGGEVNVALRHEDHRAVLIVSDHGQGISSEVREDLFEPFGKDRSRGTAGEKGTGLGLAIVKKIVDAHNGTISVDSEVGRGTTFTVSLPIGGPPEGSEQPKG